MKRDYVRHVLVFEDHFKEFKKGLDNNALKKIYQVLLLIMSVKDIPVKFLKSISNAKGLYEIRVEEGGNIYRIFCCFDEGDLVILFNGFQKKTQKTPSNEIEKAKELMKKYFKQKKEASHEK